MPYELTFDVLWQTKKLIPFLGTEVVVMFISEEDDHSPPTSRQIALLDSLDKLNDKIIPELVAWARKDFRQRLENWGITPAELTEENGFEISEDKIQNHFQLDQIVIPRIEDCRHDYVFLCGNCDWDVEHGIEFLLKDGIPIGCSAQEGLYTSAEWNDYLVES
jgi:hypothetical protein